MNDSVDIFIRELQKMMIAETRKTYGEVFFQRWQHPFNMEPMKDADVFKHLEGNCGDSMSIFLKFDNGVVQKSSFLTDGCGPSIVCGSFAAELSIGKSPEELIEITAETIINTLGGLPDDVRHCAFLAAETLHAAVDQYMIQQTSKGKESAA